MFKKIREVLVLRRLIRYVGMIKILIANELYWPEGGGVLATYLIVRLLRSLGFGVMIVRDSPNPEVVKGVKYIRGLLGAKDRFRLCF